MKPPNRPPSLHAFALAALLTLVVPLAADEPAAPEPPRPRLQVINGSSQPLDIFWLRSDTERVPNGSIEPGRQTSLTTTLGHRFLLVGREDRAEVTVTSRVPVQAVRFDPPDPDGVPAFYTQRVDAHGYPIVASAQVNPYALKEAVYLVDLMLARRPDVREAMIRSGSRLCILAWNEFTTDQPEFARLAGRRMPDQPMLSGRDFWDSRARGLGGSETDPYCSCGEENLLGYPGDPYSTENILIHEFAHNIHLRGMLNVDPTFDPRLKATYDAAMAAGLWKGKYASVNHHEYFAEGVQSWFDDNRENDHDHNHVNTRAELLEYDPGLAAMCREVFGDTVLKYTQPQTRVTGHLAGWDPSTSPRFEWPERLTEAQARIRASARARSAAATAAHPVPESPLWLTYRGGDGPGKGRHVVLIAADQEYRSEQSMPMMARILSTHHGFDCTVLFGVNERGEVDPTLPVYPEKGKEADFREHHIPGLEHLASADLVVFFTRLLTLPKSELEPIVRYVDSGKPIIALRTANHGFRGPLPYRIDGRQVRWGEDVLGGTFLNHHGRWQADSTRGRIVEAQRDHPILAGVTDIWGNSDVYRTYPEGAALPDDCTALVWGQPLMGRQPDDAPNEELEPLPVAWVKTWRTSDGRSARVFHSTMGSGTDLKNAGLRRMILNAVYWGLGMEAAITPTRSVEIVGEYQPLGSGFDYERLGVRPKPVSAYR